MDMEFERDKFKALVQYICYRCPDPRKLGATKLNKILWFSDMFTFMSEGTPLTGEKYVKRQFGPAPFHITGILDELETEGQLVIRQPELEGEPRLFIATKKPALDDFFTAEQISLVDLIHDEICDRHTAKSISDATHDGLWELAQPGEEIPYEAFLAYRTLGEATEADVRWAREAVAGAGTR